jgi:gamma-glutamyl hercynylcysteine S-oxide synthase
MAIDEATLASWVAHARRQSVDLYGDLADEELLVPYLRIINPPIWELGHVAWFQEHWVLRHALGQPPIHDGAGVDADALWNSAIIPHTQRWTAALPSRGTTLEYLGLVRDRVLAAIAAHGADERLRYFTLLSIFHEDMHGEAFAYTRQTMGWPAPRAATAGGPEGHAVGPWPGDAAIDGGTYRVGAERDPAPGFVFDNEKWAHDVLLAPFRIARAAVTQGELAAFVEDRGYETRALWTDAGWVWRTEAGATCPIWWRRDGDGRWERRVFDRWIPIDTQPHRPMVHVNAHEAEAWCRWAGRRLPSEAEWEIAARGAPIAGNLGLAVGDTVDVSAFGDADSQWGCRQMIGNVWEWTSTAFGPYPGFVRDAYKEYSEPWFGDHRVLRGGCFVTQPRLLRPTWRNFYLPDRRDVWAGFRTCAID